MYTLGEILVNVLSTLVGLLSAFVVYKLMRRKFPNATFLNLTVVLGFLALGVACLTWAVLSGCFPHLVYHIQTTPPK